MAHHSPSTHTYNGDSSTSTSQHLQKQLSTTNVFHDFMGMKKNTTDSPQLLASKTASFVSDASLSTSASLGTSDLASSEKQVRGHLEGVPFYSPRSDISGPELSTKLAGYKRSNLDSTFAVSYRDGVPQLGHDSLENSHLMKMLRNGAGGDRARRIGDEEVLFGMQTGRPTPSSLLLQHPAGSRIDAYLSKWETPSPMSLSAAMQYPPRGGQFPLLAHKVPLNKFRDTNAGPSIISQSAADEGSRTGIKGSGIVTSITANNGTGATEQNASRLHLSGSNLKSVTHISDPEASTPPRGHGVTSAGHQMTIFYGGQAHVFDDVHPNKADVIMALARSNGGSWSTTYSPKSATRTVGESRRPDRENEAGIATNMACSKEFRGRLSTNGNSSHGVSSSGDWVSTPGGGNHNQGGFAHRERRNQVQGSEPRADEKGEV